jgi:hypothetical protein
VGDNRSSLLSKVSGSQVESEESESKRKRNRKLSLYIGAAVDWITGGRFILSETISAIGIKPLYDRILTKDKVSKVYFISQFPVLYDRDFIEDIRTECFLQYPDIKLFFSFECIPVVNGSVDNDRFLRQMNVASQNYESFKTAFESLSPLEQITGKFVRISRSQQLHISKQRVQKLEETFLSYKSVFTSTKAGNSYFNVNLFFHVIAPNNRMLNKFEALLKSRMSDHGTSYGSIRGLLPMYLDNYAPATFTKSGAKKYPSMLFSNENIAKILPTRTVGIEVQSGTLMGVNCKNALPFFLELFSSGQGQTFMFLGKTGSGKTYAAFEFVISLLGQGVHVSVTDLKGNEWNRLSPLVESLVINLDGTNPRFVNTLRLDDMDCDTAEEAIEAYDLAVSGSVTLLSLLCGIPSNTPESQDLNLILEQSIVKLFNEHHVVKDNPKTFIYTRGIKYTDVTPKLSEISHTAMFTESQRNMCALAATRCDLFFNSSGRYSDAFKNEITTNEVYNTPLIIYALNKNSNQDLDTLDTLKVFMSQYLTTKKNHRRKRKKLHSALVAEEVQRYESGSRLVKFLSDTTTGSRSENVMVVFLLNALTKLEAAGLGAVTSNISTFIIGKTQKEDRKLLQDKFDLSDIKDDLEEISKENSKLPHTFVCQYDTGNTQGKVLYKAFLPREFAKTLSTRDIVL